MIQLWDRQQEGHDKGELKRIVEKHKEIEAVQREDICTVECDIFAPCALGGILNDETIPKLKSKIAAGAANNQLKEDKHGDLLYKRAILYAPIYAINAGGTTDDVDAFEKSGYNPERGMRKAARSMITQRR